MSTDQLLQELQSEARKTYIQVTPTSTDVFMHNGQKGIRVEAPEIVMEFLNGVPIGRVQVRGLLYFNSIKPQFRGDMQYTVSIEQRKEGHLVKEEVLIVGFWAKEDDYTKVAPYAKFIAPVPIRAWGRISPHHAVGGRWELLDVLQATSLATSKATERKVTININTLKKKFEFQIPDGMQVGSVIECFGSLIVRDTTQLVGSGFFVDYTNTRITIFKKQNDPHPVAVFSPFDLQADQPLVDISFQTEKEEDKGKFIDL